MKVLWSLHAVYPKNLALSPVVVPGLTHVEAIIHAIVEIIHAFTICDVEGFTPVAAKLYLQLLLSSDTTISFNAKQAIIKVLRPRYKKRKTYISQPSHHNSSAIIETDKKSSTIPISSISEQGEESYNVDNVVSMVLMGTERNQVGAAAGTVNPLEALLDPDGFPQLLDIPQAEDDEAMVELAIALSLQEHEGGEQVLPEGFSRSLGSFQGLDGIQNLNRQGLQALQSLQDFAAQELGQVVQAPQIEEGSHYSDTTASRGGSDDEGSTVATDGSTLRISPAEHAGSTGSKDSESGGSESGGSAVDSIIGEHSASCTSSVYGDTSADNALRQNQHIRSDNNILSKTGTSTITKPEGRLEQEKAIEQEDMFEQESDVTVETAKNLHKLRLLLLDRIMQFIPNLSQVSGVRTIPFMQVRIRNVLINSSYLYL